MLRKFLFVLVAVLASACGTLPPPAYEQPTLTFEAQEQAHAASTSTADAIAALQPTKTDGSVVAAAPTTVPTEAPTLVPPTATPTEVPATPTVAEPTMAPTTVAVDPAAADNDPLGLFILSADAAHGAELVKGTYDAEDGTQWSCATCHNFDSEAMKIGPGLAGVGTRAYTRIPGTGPYTYLYNSIRNPHDYVVPGFENGTMMPHFTTTSLTDAMIYDIVAYLSTLK